MSNEYDDIIEEAARRFNVDPRLVRSVIRQESNFRPRAESPQGAQGLMQLMPDTARSLGVRDPFNPRENIMAGTRYLAQMLDQYEDPRVALMAYHGGPDTRIWGQRTRAYPQQVLGHYERFAPAQAPAEGQPPAQAQPPAQGQPIAQAQPPAQVATEAPQVQLMSGNTQPPGQIQQARAAGQGGQRGFTFDDLVSGEDATQGQVDAHVPEPGIQREQGSWWNMWMPQRIRGQQGMMRGMRDMVDRPAEWIAGLAERSGATQALRNSPLGRVMSFPTQDETIVGNARDRAQFDQTLGTSGAASVGRAAGQAAATALPLLSAGRVLGGVGQVMNATGVVPQSVVRLGQNLANPAGAPNLMSRFSAGALQGAAQGGAGAALTADPSQPIMPQIEQGATWGGAAGAAMPAIQAPINAARRAFLPETPRGLADLAEVAVNRYGIRVPGSRMGGDHGGITPWLDDAASLIPGSGANRRNADLSRQFGAAVNREMGETGSDLSRATMDAVRRRAGRVMEDVAQNSNMPVPQMFSRNLRTMARDAQDSLTEPEAAVVGRAVDRILAMVPSGSVTGQVYQNLTRGNTPLSRLAENANPNIRNYARQIREHLDDMLEQAHPAQAERLREARRQYYIASTLREYADESGRFSMPRFAAEFDDSRVPAMRELASIARHFIAPNRSSGTLERAAAYSLLGGGNSFLYYMHPELMAAAAGGQAASSLAARGSHAALRSDWYRNMRIREGRNPTQPGAGVTNRLLERAVPPLAGAVGRQNFYSSDQEQDAPFEIPPIIVTAPRP